MALASIGSPLRSLSERLALALTIAIAKSSIPPSIAFAMGQSPYRSAKLKSAPREINNSARSS